MVLCSIALHANVVTGTCGDNLTWSYDTDTKALTIEGSGAMTDYDYDYDYDYLNDNRPWAQVKGDILFVSLPEGLTTIGKYAFYDCSSLTSITIPNSVTSIGEYTFGHCSALTSVTLGNSVTSIGAWAFYDCSSLTKTNYTGDIASWCNIQFTNYTANPISFSKNLYLNDVLVTDLVIPEGVTNVGKYAFYDCSSITSVTLPNSVTRIGSSAFHSCSSLTSITIPNSVTSIGNSAFYNCYSLTSVSLGNSVTSIRSSAFSSCYSLTSVTIPNSVTSIGGDAFSSCTQVTVECTTPPTIESGTFKPDANIFVPCSALDTYLQTTIWQWLDLKGLSHTVNLSATEGGKATITATDCDANTATIEAISYGCRHFVQWSDGNTDNPRTLNLTQDTTLVAQFESTTYQINIFAGENGSLTRYGEPIGNIETTMTDCDSDGEWIDNICAVPEDGYYFAGWSDGYADACRSIGVVSDTTLVAHFAEKQQVQVLVGVEPACKNMGTVSGSGIFYQGDVVTITATPNEGYHFVEWSDNGDGHATRDILLTSDTTLIATFSAGDMGGKCGDNLYWTWDNGALTITGSGDMDLFTYPAWWQYPIDIQSVSFPEAMTSISAYAFYGYNSYAVYQAPYSLKEAIIPANVTYIGYASFAACPQLTKWQYNGTQLEVQYAEGYDVFNGDAALTFLQAPAELVEYRNNNWSNLDTLIVISGEIGEVPSNVRYLDLRNATNSTLRLNGRENLTTLYLPNGYTEIADKALLGCKHLGGITIPADVTRIGESAFEDCRSMDSVVFAGNNVQEIGDWAFYNCHSLRSLTLPEGIEEIGRAAFFDCTYLNELTLPSTMKKIADNGFAGCEKMKKMYVNALVPPTIEAKTFEDVDRATTVFVPKGTIARYQADQYWSEFFNMAEYEAPTGNLNTAADNDANALRKVLRNGQVLILRGDKTYTILGEAL